MHAINQWASCQWMPHGTVWRCPPITLTSERRCPVWRLVICIKTPSGVVRKIHWAWSDLSREKRVRLRQSLFIVICDLTPFTDLTLGLFGPTLRAPCFVVHFAQRLIKLTKYLRPNFAYVRFGFSFTLSLNLQSLSLPEKLCSLR